MTTARPIAVRRLSLPLTARDEQDLSMVRSSEAHLAALERLSGAAVTSGSVSEAALLHALLEAGLRAVREATEDAGYAEVAAQLAIEVTGHRAQARRRRPAWADEA